MLQIFNILFKGRLSSKFNLIFMKSFPYSPSLLLFINLIRYLILFQSSVYFFNTFLFSSIEAKVTCLFPLLSSMYPCTSHIIRYRVYTVNFYIIRIFPIVLTNVINISVLYDFLSIFSKFGSKFLILIISSKK